MTNISRTSYLPKIHYTLETLGTKIYSEPNLSKNFIISKSTEAELVFKRPKRGSFFTTDKKPNCDSNESMFSHLDKLKLFPMFSTRKSTSEVCKGNFFNFYIIFLEISEPCISGNVPNKNLESSIKQKKKSFINQSNKYNSIDIYTMTPENKNTESTEIKIQPIAESTPVISSRYVIPIEIRNELRARKKSKFAKYYFF